MARYRIYYARQIPDLTTPPATHATLAQTHVLVRELDADSLGEVYMRMQAESWASHDDLAAFSRHVYDLGSFHTSMNAGDVVENTIDGTFHLCDFFGWSELE